MPIEVEGYPGPGGDLVDDKLRLLMQSMGGALFEKEGDPAILMNMLMRETIRFRDKLKQETGVILTVGDTRVALEGLDEHMRTNELPDSLTSEQRSLVQIWIDKLTLFNT